MTYRGRIKNGVVVFEQTVSLPEGTEVEVILPSRHETGTEHASVPTLFEQFRELIGCLKGLPPDLAENHDYYIHGRPKE